MGHFLVTGFFSSNHFFRCRDHWPLTSWFIRGRWLLGFRIRSLFNCCSSWSWKPWYTKPTVCYWRLLLSAYSWTPRGQLDVSGHQIWTRPSAQYPAEIPEPALQSKDLWSSEAPTITSSFISNQTISGNLSYHRLENTTLQQRGLFSTSDLFRDLFCWIGWEKSCASIFNMRSKDWLYILITENWCAQDPEGAEDWKRHTVTFAKPDHKKQTND